MKLLGVETIVKLLEFVLLRVELEMRFRSDVLFILGSVMGWDFVCGDRRLGVKELLVDGEGVLKALNLLFICLLKILDLP